MVTIHSSEAANEDEDRALILPSRTQIDFFASFRILDLDPFQRIFLVCHDAEIVRGLTSEEAMGVYFLRSKNKFGEKWTEQLG